MSTLEALRVNDLAGAASMRREVPDLPSSRPLVTLLPSIFQEDDFAVRWLSALDQVLAPIESALDSSAAYFDPTLAPADFVDWLGRWIGVVIDDEMSLSDRRNLVSSLADLYAMRGTPAGVRRLLELSVPVHVELIESGGSSFSTIPGSSLPGSDIVALLVQIRGRNGAVSEHHRRLCSLLVNESRPAHLPAALEFL